MIYLLDSNVLITANNTYYPIKRVPEFWEWLLFHANVGMVKMPLEIIEEVLAGTKENDLMLDWMKGNKSELLLEEEVDPILVNRAVSEGYAPDLTDDEIEQIGRDPFLIAYALKDPVNRCVVTTETPAPSKIRQNRKLPDVCATFSIPCPNTFRFTEALDFRTNWKEYI